MVDYLDRTYALAWRALDGGGQQKRPTVIEWDVSGRCTSPVYVERTGRASPAHGQKRIFVDAAGKWGRRTSMTVTVEMHVPCRKCKHCLQARALLWRKRAMFEVAKSTRTWFGTLTLNPQSHFEDLTAARVKATRRGSDFDLLDNDEKYRRRVEMFNRRVTLMFKRVRKNSGADFRYILVYERHKSGDPHAHCLVHEATADDIVTKRIWESQWHGGFSSWRLVDTTDATAIYYVTKYLAKDAALRIRASLHYGEGSVSGGPQTQPKPIEFDLKSEDALSGIRETNDLLQSTLQPIKNGRSVFDRCVVEAQTSSPTGS